MSKLIIGFSLLILFGCLYKSKDQKSLKPRVIVSSDIGGTDPDDFQSMIHLLMYADLVKIEGLISSPYGNGRKKDFLDMIDLYAKDLDLLQSKSPDFPHPDSLRSVCKQGAIPGAPYKGFDTSTEGSNWIINCAKKPSDQHFWILVWGGLEDLAQAFPDGGKIFRKNLWTCRLVYYS